MIREVVEKLVYGKANDFEIGTRAPILFVHIPKTAGTSIRQFLGNQYHTSEICPSSNWRDLAFADRAIGSYKLVQGHYGVNIREMLPAGFRTLTMMRDPIQRTVSAIRHLQRDPHFHPLHDRIKSMTLSQILRDESLASNFRNNQTGYLSAQQPPAEILKYLKSKKGYAEPWDIEGPADLERAKRRLDTIEFVGVSEDIESLLHPLCSEMLFHYPVFPPRVNVAPTDDSLGITEDDLSVLRDLNDLDIELYDYARVSRHPRTGQGFEFKSLMRTLCAEGIYRVQSQSFKINICDRIPGSGWYEPERGRKCIRWTGPRREFSLELPIEPDASYRIRLRFMSPVKLSADEFRIIANAEVHPVRLQHWWGRSYTASCVISKDTLAGSEGFCELVFQTPKVFKPDGRRSTDVRSLGIAVISVAFDRLSA